MFSNFLSENRAVYVVKRDSPQMAGQYGACALHGGKIRLQTQPQNM